MPLHRDSLLAPLLDSFGTTGVVAWMGVRPARRAAMREVTAVAAVADYGLEGDRAAQTRGGKRQVSLIQFEHLAVIAALCGHSVTPAQLRRNIAVAGINLSALHNRRFRIGEVILQGSGYCHPCSRMETTVGAGAFNAMRGHGGITARILHGGELCIGASIEPLPE